MIEAVRLRKHYGRTKAVDDLSFTVRPGRVTGFLGPNGAGKSTTMRMILGLDTPTGGDVKIDGKHYAEFKQPLREVGALLDAKWVHPNRSARSHLKWLAVSNKIPVSRVQEVLEIVGLTEVAHKNAGGFSLGMSQRLGIAGALLGDPGVLLFDEPVNGLDPEGILWIRQFLHRLADEGRTVFVSSHLLSEMAQTAQDLIVIGKGQLIAQTSTEQFIADATQDTVRVRSPHAAKLREILAAHATVTDDSVSGSLVVHGIPAQQIGDLAAENQITLHELSPQRGSLEEAFMQLTKESVEYHAH
ncbi:ABC transporter ATP-binding protein [Lentzea sp.]|uniref:ABC transporter ATP-binding protein n=1 Tax=Lentzea sp. TaxID=56099 RepID=UPI002C9DE248|nr:ABC transporter ATP-binding protein [Lentzea sp.]HUQ56870.1 ABC transporter ATP-binding protein [Lentzea sp.]